MPDKIISHGLKRDKKHVSHEANTLFRLDAKLGAVLRPTILFVLLIIMLQKLQRQILSLVWFGLSNQKD